MIKLKHYDNIRSRVRETVHELVHELGGSISAEHGIGQMKCDELARLGDPVQLQVMRAVKRADAGRRFCSLPHWKALT